MQNNKGGTHTIGRVWASVNNVMAAYGLSRNTLYSAIAENLIKSRLVKTKIAGGQELGRRLINIASLERFIESCDIAAPTKLTRKMRRLGKASGIAKRANKIKHRHKGPR